MDSAQPPLIPETLLKRRRSLDELALKRSQSSENINNKKQRTIRGGSTKLKRPEQFVKEYLAKEGTKKRLNRKRKLADKKSSSTISQSVKKSTVGFVVRIHDGKNLNGVVKAQLGQLKLNKLYDGQFIILNEQNIRKLQALDDYIIYGYVSKQSVIELVHRRSFIQQDGIRKPLSDNLIVEKLLGEYGIICLNDLSDEIFTIGSHFQDALTVLSTYKLSAPIGGYESKILKKKDELMKKGGFIDDQMDEFLQKIL